jgi:hypothetical protein
MDVENPARPASVVGAGRGSLILAMAGAGWLGWGLGVAQAFNAVVGSIFGAVAIFLWGCSIGAMRTGRTLRRQLPPSSGPEPRFPTKPFILVVLVEALAIALVLLGAAYFHRSDLAVLGCALVVGLHYLPLAKIFRAPILAFLGILTAIWCAFSWVLVRSNALVVAVTIGTGVLMWAASIATLLRARQLTRSLRSSVP